MRNPPVFTNWSLLLPYALPYLIYVGFGLLPETSLPRELNYSLRLLFSAAALVWAWNRYVSLRGPRLPIGSVAAGLVAGTLGTALWIALALPLVGTGGTPWPVTAFWIRLAAAALVVPVFEELLMRGYVLRLTVQWDRARRAGSADALTEALDQSSVNAVEPGAWTPFAVLLSTLLFTIGHRPAEWPAALIYGLLMATLWIVRKDLLSCVTAHAVTNVLLAVYVRSTGHWALW